MLDKLLHPHPGASEPESGGQYPGTQALSIEDYHRILQESFGAVAADIARLRAEVGVATDRSASVKVLAVNQTYQIPTGPWRSVYISRPSYAEVFSKGASNFTDLNIAFDGTFTGIVSYQGISVFPYFGWHEFQLQTASTMAASWSIDVFFTTRQYEATSYFGY